MSARTSTPARGDRDSSIAALATAYAQGRDPDDLHRLRLAVRRAPNYNADLDPVRVTAPLLEGGDFAEAVRVVRALMPGAFLSPSAHSALAKAYDGLGDATRARREARTARLALEAITSSGDGSQERPWPVLRVSDEYDVLREQGRASRTQRLVTFHGRRLDHHECSDGSEAWFDVDLLDPGASGS
jgi:hypothetical protein